MNRQFPIKAEGELEQIADMMYDEIKSQNDDIVSRYTRTFHDAAQFIDGQRKTHIYWNTCINKENMDSGVYTVLTFDELSPDNFDEVCVGRDIYDHRFNFQRKGIPLPTDAKKYMEPIPQGIDLYDAEFEFFTRDHRNTRVHRDLIVEQRVIVNSNGGISIQTIPYLEISYSHGYTPIPTSRNISVVCTSEANIKRLPCLIKYLADPTPDRKIKKSKSFSEAFHNLHSISRLKLGSLEEAGFPLSGLHDAIVLTGVPAHEIFGHHLEEPVRYLDYGETAAFKYEQSIGNENITMIDNPEQRIEGFRPLGFTHIDAYGRTREKRTLIERGKIRGFLGSEYLDQRNIRQYLNMEKSNFVGNAHQDNSWFFPQPRMSCTVLDGATENIDMEGKILLVSDEGSTQPRDKTYMIKANECYVVNNGEPKRIIPLQMTGGINQALANMILLNDLNYQTGKCGKPEPIYEPSRGYAEAPVSQFARSQMWRAQQIYPLPISDIHLRVLM